MSAFDVPDNQRQVTVELYEVRSSVCKALEQVIVPQKDLLRSIARSRRACAHNVFEDKCGR